jgi:uncharacterized protein (TIGR03083 family)
VMRTTTFTSAQLIPQLTPDQVAEVATAELAASLALLQNLTGEEWTHATDCAGWTVHDLTAHMLGQYQGLASPWVYLRRHRRAHRRYPTLSRLDADDRQQIDELGGQSGDELVAMLAAIGPKAIRARRRVPKLVRRLHIGRMYPEESLSDDRLSYMFDVLGLRDPWMHRVDLARATGRPMTLDAHDQLIVAQVIADLGRTWEEEPPVLIELTGLAGGRWSLGHGKPRATVRADVVDYKRTLSGREHDPTLETDGDQVAVAAVAGARVVF